jgi:hypothetical protein
MKKPVTILLTLTILIILIFPCQTISQTSSLVYPGADGTLIYVPYANKGQDNAVNIIPDFSHTGYMGGGVSIPDVPVVETLYPEPGDARSRIQAAIDRVSMLPLDANGFRGAVLLTSGRYEIDGSLDINSSGVVLRGEGQNTPENGGTELVATAQTQHSFIRLQGNEIMVNPVSELTLDTQQYPDADNWIAFNVTNGIIDELEGDKIISFHIFTDINQFTSYTSREDPIQKLPTLEVTLSPDTTGSDSVITLYPIADTYVRGGDDADNNFGAEDALAIKNGGTTLRVTREVYIKFDLSSVTEEISHAELKLYGKKDLSGEPIQVVFHTVAYLKDDSWEEMEITYNNRPMDDVGTALQRITTPYVATGAVTFDVDSASQFNVGDTIIVIRTPNQTWIDELDMAQYGWTADSYTIGYERIITGITGNTISINIPLVQAMQDLYGGGSVYKTSIKGRIRNCGVENMMLTSVYTDENHGWNAVWLSETSDCWVRNVTARYFGYSCVLLNWAYNTTVEQCAMLDPKSITTGSRKYSFKIDKGSCNLVQRCFTRGGRHDYVTGSRVAGPNVFVDCLAVQTNADIGPHSRYATGVLFDNIKGGEIRVQNRRDMGTGHGWAGAQTMFWNCVSTVDEFKVESPIGAMNWGIGCNGLVRSGAGLWESWGTRVTPRSLYYKQLEDRLGTDAVINVTIPDQRGELNIWDKLSTWAGIGDLELTTHVDSEDEHRIRSYSLAQNYPNPFNPTTNIRYVIPIEGHVEIAVFDLLGRKVATLVNKTHQAGVYSITFDVANHASGVYFYRIEADGFVSMKKMIVLQ